MPSPASAKWPQPKGDEEFEDMVLDSLRQRWGNASAHRYGRSGQKQHGIDILGHPANLGGLLVAAQCKNINSATLALIQSEVKKTSSFPDALAKYVFVVASARDARLQDEVREFSARRETEGLFAVEILFYEDVCQALAENPLLVAKHFPGWSSLGIMANIADSPHIAKNTDPRNDELDRLLDTLKSKGRRSTRKDLTSAMRAAKLAIDLGHSDKLERSIVCATHALVETVIHRPHGKRAPSQELVRLIDMVDKLANLGASEERVALLRADVIGLTGDDQAVLRSIEGVQFTSAEARVSALMLRLQSNGMLGRFEDSIRFRSEIMALGGELGDRRLEVEILWLRTLMSAGSAEPQDIARFVEIAQSFKHANLDDIAIIRSLEHFVHSFADQEQFREAFGLLDLLAVQADDDLGLAIQYKIWSAGLKVRMEDEVGAREDLWTAERLESRVEGKDRTLIRGMRLLETAQLLGDLAHSNIRRSDQAVSDWRACNESLDEALVILRESGDRVSPEYLQRAYALKARVALKLGEIGAATRAYATARTIPVHSEFGPIMQDTDAYNEAFALALDGRVETAVAQLDKLLVDPSVTAEIRDQVTTLKEHLETHAMSVIGWLTGEEGRDITVQAENSGTRHAIAELVRPLSLWWDLWEAESQHLPAEFSRGTTEDSIFQGWLERGPECIYDYWGRGGLARLAAILRSQPNGTIAVDALTVEQIRKWAQILCPMADTLVVRWKGHLEQCAGYLPRPDNPVISFGGHGYALIARQLIPGWVPGIGWSSWMPRDVITFMHGEGRDLIAAGRLIIVPAPLVGCTQTATGWTDAMFSESLCGGIVSVIKSGSHSGIADSKTIDLSQITIPYISGIGMGDMARVLDECEPWLAKLRSRVFGSMDEDLRQENWVRVRAYHNDIVDALAEIGDRFDEITKNSSANWLVRTTDATASVGNTELTGDQASSGIQTQILSTIASASRPLGPWIPYWKLKGIGGNLRWSGETDYHSVPPDAEFRSLYAVDKVPNWLIHTWLHPGTIGEGWLAVKIED